MKTTKIDWCNATINPVVGCKFGCSYCYARKANQRFKWIPKWEEPQFFPERLKALKSKKPKSIFMNSMSDFSYWKEEWALDVLKVIELNSQHNYIFLTKSNYIFTDELPNVFNGRTITNQKQADSANHNVHYNFYSIEPILAPIKLYIRELSKLRQIIIGAETGNRKGKVIPQKEWIDNLVKQADETNIRVFMKSSLKRIMGDDFRQDELIWEKK